MTEYEKEPTLKNAVLRAAVSRLLLLIRDEVTGSMADGQVHVGPQRARIRAVVAEVSESLRGTTRLFPEQAAEPVRITYKFGGQRACSHSRAPTPRGWA